ncbi:hypothetical protein [Paenibacillus agricola]|uniref:Uncharacterized protein n=1 Tax=Paenibacillus agricola TaxID=2716264 RepID=A0ABX0JA37_9BACL|nr:hypothetical protein [Paenibacillus agricola]NHN31737.1 hypothetical protein [Paenibacillus agricola]
MAIQIPLKGNKNMELDDIIKLAPKQWAKIFERSVLKTEKQWLQPKTNGIKIKLTSDQRQDVILHKNGFVEKHSGDSLMLDGKIRFTDHGLQRISERIDKMPPETPPSEAAMRAMVDLVIRSTEVSQDAEWRGYASLSYSFKGTYEQTECAVVVVFEGDRLVITEVTDIGETVNVTSLIQEDQLQRLQAFRDQLQHE